MNEYDALNTLNTCLDQLTTGCGVDACLTDNPPYAAELRGLLELGVRIPQLLPAQAETDQARGRVYARLEREFAVSRPQNRQPVLPGIVSLRFALRLAVVTSLMLISTALLAQASLPGDLLYPAKRFTEDVSLVLSAYAPQVQQFVQQRRIDEANAVLSLQREADLNITGIIESISDTEIHIAGLIIEAGRAMYLGTQYAAGDELELVLRSTGDGRLLLQHAHLIHRPQEPELLPAASPNPDPSPTVSPTPTASRTVTPAPTHTDQPRPSSTPAPASPERVHASPTPRYVLPAIPATDCTRSTQGYRYQVQSGDTLSSLALRSDTTIAELMRINCLEDAALIIAGQMLYLPRQPGQVWIPASPGAESSPDNQPTQSVSQPADADTGQASQQGGPQATPRSDNGHQPPSGQPPPDAQPPQTSEPPQGGGNHGDPPHAPTPQRHPTAESPHGADRPTSIPCV